MKKDSEVGVGLITVLLHVRLHSLLFLSVVLLVSATYLHSQNNENLHFRHLQKKDGLSQSWIKSFCQDYHGYIWIGTNEGLNKFNGTNITVYKNIPGDTLSLSNNSVNAIFEDSQNNLWFGTSIGLNLYNRDLGAMERIAGFENRNISAIYELEDRRLIVITPAEFIHFDYNTGKVSSLFNKAIPPESEFFKGNLIQCAPKKYAMLTIQGVYLFYSSTNEFKIVNSKFKGFNSKAKDFTCIYKDSKGRIWIGCEPSGIYLLRCLENETITEAKYFSHIPGRYNTISNSPVEVFMEDDEERLWVGTSNDGINILDLKTELDEQFRITHYRHNPQDNHSLRTNAITSIFKDYEGTMWVGTFQEGLSTFSHQRNIFRTHRYSQFPGAGLNNNCVNVIYDEADQLWMGTQNGLNVMDKGSGRWRHYATLEADKHTLGSNAIWAVHRDRQDRLWVGSWAGGLNLLNEKRGDFKRYMHDPEDSLSIASNNVFGITESNDGRIWIATMGGGINVFNPEDETFERILAGQGRGLISNSLKCIYLDDVGDFWIATSMGLNVYNESLDKFYSFRNDVNSKGSISSDFIIDIFQDSRGNMWIGTENGLNLFDWQTRSFTYYTEKDGLPNNFIRGICEDNNGNLWISTNNGLSKFVDAISVPIDPLFENFTVDDGLQSDEFNSRSRFKGKDYMYFGGNRGADFFNPEKIQTIKDTLIVHINKLLLFNKEIVPGADGSPLDKQISLTENLELSYKNSVISLEYSALDFVSPDKIHYRYILDGFDEAWNMVGKRTEATYTNLNPGKYTFRAQASKVPGYWNSLGGTLNIFITPPWWKTLIAKVMFSFLVISVLLIAYKLRIGQLHRQRDRLQLLVRKRTAEILEKNEVLEHQAEELNQINAQLLDEQKRVKEQSKELFDRNEELQKLNITKDKFFSIISHDLRSPFSSIISLSNDIIENLADYEEKDKDRALKIVAESSNNIFRLLDNLLSWAKTQTGKIDFAPEQVGIHNVVQEIHLLLDGTLQKKNLYLDYSNVKGVKVYADKNMLFTILLNLITNALKFTKEGGVAVKVEPGNDFDLVKVIDTGIGMQQEAVDQLFRIDKATSTRGTMGETGTGIGLLICYEFVGLHGGKIEVESIPEKGTSFGFTLPSAPEA